MHGEEIIYVHVMKNCSMHFSSFNVKLVSFRTWHQVYVTDALATFEVFFLHHPKFQITNFYYLSLISPLLSSLEINMIRICRKPQHEQKYYKIKKQEQA